MTEDGRAERHEDADHGRRRALHRLGLAATAAYFAPQVTRLGTASAQGLPSPGCPPGRPGCAGSPPRFG